MAIKQQLTFDIEPDLSEALAEWARQEGRLRANLIRRLLTAALERRDRRQQAAERKAA
jgi:hypothetical protein